MIFAYKGKPELVDRAASPPVFARPRRAVRRVSRRLPRGIGLTLALIVSLGLWALLAYAVTRLLGL